MFFSLLSSKSALFFFTLDGISPCSTFFSFENDLKINICQNRAIFFSKNLFDKTIEWNLDFYFKQIQHYVCLFFFGFYMKCGLFRKFASYFSLFILLQGLYNNFVAEAFQLKLQEFSLKPLQGFDNKDSIKEKLFLRKFSSSFSPSGALYSSKQINTYASPWERAKDLCESADIPLKKISLLGSTGSIGRQTLSVVNSCSNNFRIVALAANSNVKLLAEQIKDFRPEAVSLRDESKIDELKQLLQSMGVFEFPEIYGGEEGIIQIAKHPTADTVVTGIVGCAGLKPTIAAIKSKKNIALANKETLIAAGPVIIPLLREYGNTLSPADSEHSAIFQCLQGVPEGSIKRLILTASGGSFRDKKKEDLQNVTLDDALKHPNWSMGKKITIDSATLMNKGLEVIEAHFLFGVDYKNIDVLIHPQSIIHSMVELTDTSMLAQLGIPDMRLPLLYALSYPHRFKMDYKSLDLAEVKTLDFRHPDTSMFPCLELAYEAGKIGGTAPAAINAANEQAVSMFCDGKIKFVDIPVIIEKVLMSHTPKKNDLTVEDITEVDLWGRKKAEEVSK